MPFVYRLFAARRVRSRRSDPLYSRLGGALSELRPDHEQLFPNPGCGRVADHTSAAARCGASCQRGDISSESYNFGQMEVPMATAQLIDQAKQEAFVNKVLGYTSATMTTILASIGDRLGLFKDLATKGPGTSAEVARRTGTNERYVHEWLGGMVAAGYVEYDPATSRFTLPAEHAAAIATEGGPFFFGGIHQMLPALVAVVDQRPEESHNGGDVRQANYPSGMWDGLERFTAVWFNTLL